MGENWRFLRDADASFLRNFVTISSKNFETDFCSHFFSISSGLVDQYRVIITHFLRNSYTYHDDDKRSE